MLLNAVIIGIWWTLSAHCPKIMLVTVESNTAVEYAFSFGRSLAFSGNGAETKHVIFPVDFSSDTIILTKKKTSHESRIVSALLFDRLFLTYRWNAPHIIDATGEQIKLQLSNSESSAFPWFSLIFAALEFCILLVSFVAVKISRNDDPGNVLESVAFSVALGLVICVIIPFQSYLGNDDAFKFSASELLRDTLLPMAETIVGTFMALLQ